MQVTSMYMYYPDKSVLVYKDSGYVETVVAAAEQSMVRAVKEATEKSGGQEVSTICVHA